MKAISGVEWSGAGSCEISATAAATSHLQVGVKGDRCSEDKEVRHGFVRSRARERGEGGGIWAQDPRRGGEGECAGSADCGAGSGCDEASGACIDGGGGTTTTRARRARRRRRRR